MLWTIASIKVYNFMTLAKSSSDSSSDESSKPVRAPGVEPGRAKRTVGPVTPAAYKKPVGPKPGAKISAAER